MNPIMVIPEYAKMRGVYSSYLPYSMQPSNLIPIIISNVSTVLAVIGLFMTREDMKRRERKDQEMYVNGIYSNFQNLQLKFIQRAKTLQILANDRNQTEEEVVRNAMSSLMVNQAFDIFELQENNYLEAHYWEVFKVDMKLLFSRPSIISWWQAMKHHYPKSFQDFIDTQIQNK